MRTGAAVSYFPCEACQICRVVPGAASLKGIRNRAQRRRPLFVGQAGDDDVSVDVGHVGDRQHARDSGRAGGIRCRRVGQVDRGMLGVVERQGGDLAGRVDLTIRGMASGPRPREPER